MGQMSPNVLVSTIIRRFSRIEIKNVQCAAAVQCAQKLPGWRSLKSGLTEVTMIILYFLKKQ
jgi:hypothetical protein